MLVPVALLRSFSDPPLSTEELAARLTMTGTKDERVFHHGVSVPAGYVVGHVLEAAPHPNADRLRVCTVDIGEAEPATIVCGAPNVAAGQTVAVARPGAVLPGGDKLRRAKLRGVVSEGMILSESELAIGVEHDGILELDTPARPGTPLSDVLPLGTDVIEFEITPNRPDCLGVYGIAREVHASTGAPLAPPPWGAPAAGAEGGAGGASVVVECPDLCPRFMARAFESVRIGASPPWLKASLLAAGMRPINNVVDITNHVMLVTAQPLHAFDLDRVAGRRLVVRRSRDGEPVRTLDGQERRLDSETVVICDDDGPTSIAGIMGGARSEVSPDTTSVLIEAATWIGANIQRSSARLGLRSEASGRFEKGLEPEAAAEALALAGDLLVALCDARALPGTIDVGGPGPPPRVIGLRPERVRGLLGARIGPDRSAEILTSLGFGVAAGEPEGVLDVSVPPFRRADVTREVDLIEEVARIDGVDRLPATLPPGRPAGRLTHAQRARRRAEDILVGRGLHEVVGWSFAAPELLDRLRLPAGHPMRRTVTIANPLSDPQSIMRPTILGSLLDIARHNVARGAGELAIFESGSVYRSRRAAQPGESPADEHHALGGLLTGAAGTWSWRTGAPPPADFFAARSLAAAVLDGLRVDWSIAAMTWPFLHPGRSAEVRVGDPASMSTRRIGFVGELHPAVSVAWDLKQTAVFTLNLDVVAAAAPSVITYRDFGDFPAVLQDLSVIVAEDVAAESVVSVVRDHAGPDLASVSVFDVYRGAQVGEGRTSLTLHLEFRAADRTLTDEDVAARRAAITTALAEQVGGELRG
ncbi:MAG: phenylalanine--tRNA ligase subunit beta [Solirubrobacteraceae bacterium]